MHRRFVLVSVASEVAAAKGWLPGYFEFYFKGKAMAEAAAAEAAGEGNAYVVKPSFIYGGDSFELFPPRVASGYGAAIEEILSNAIITKIADVLPGLLKVALRPPSSVDAVAEACVRCAVGDCATTVLDGTVAINDAAGAEKANGYLGGLYFKGKAMSPQGGLVADAQFERHDRRHGQTREREVEDASTWHVDVVDTTAPFIYEIAPSAGRRNGTSLPSRPTSTMESSRNASLRRTGTMPSATVRDTMPVRSTTFESRRSLADMTREPPVPSERFHNATACASLSVHAFIVSSSGCLCSLNLCGNQPVSEVGQRRVGGVGRPSFDFHTGLNESIVTSSVSKSVSTKPCGAGGFAGLCGSPKSGRSSSPATSGAGTATAWSPRAPRRVGDLRDTISTVAWSTRARDRVRTCGLGRRVMAGHFVAAAGAALRRAHGCGHQCEVPARPASKVQYVWYIISTGPSFQHNRRTGTV